MTILTSRLETSETARHALAAKVDEMQQLDQREEGCTLSPHLLWERVQELTASELHLKETVQGLEGELETAQARVSEAKARAGAVEGDGLRLQLAALGMVSVTEWVLS